MVVDVGDYRGLGAPAKPAATPASYRLPPPRFAEHREAVLREAGFTEAEIAALAASGIAPEVMG